MLDFTEISGPSELQGPAGSIPVTHKAILYVFFSSFKEDITRLQFYSIYFFVDTLSNRLVA